MSMVGPHGKLEISPHLVGRLVVELSSLEQAKFIYDLSPISVSYRLSSRHWYDYCTSVFALIGGMFTVVGLIESSLHATVAQVQRANRPAYRR
jgi:hypothetical protein